MTDGQETLWRKALEAKGKDWVMAELRRRPGKPNDTVYDIVFEDPLPTRDFCERWCAQEDNKLVHWTWQTKLAVAFAILSAVCIIKAVESWNDVREPKAAVSTAIARPASLPQGSGGPTGVTNVPSSSAPTTMSSVNQPSLCSYQTYATAECQSQQH